MPSALQDTLDTVIFRAMLIWMIALHHWLLQGMVRTSVASLRQNMYCCVVEVHLSYLQLQSILIVAQRLPHTRVSLSISVTDRLQNPRQLGSRHDCVTWIWSLNRRQCTGLTRSLQHTRKQISNRRINKPTSRIRGILCFAQEDIFSLLNRM